MSTDEDGLVFESFLKKRKKRMKLKWVTYWFRLQNSVLCFSSQRSGGSLQLKGQYYIWMVQSVREIHKVENKRYAFEISMKNGKRKLLAADTADLRQTWVDFLWRAMQSPVYRHPDPACIRLEGAELTQSGWASLHSSPAVGQRRELDCGRLRASSEPWRPSLILDPRCPATPPTSALKSSPLAAASIDSVLWRSSLEPQDEEEKDAEEEEYEILQCRMPAASVDSVLWRSSLELQEEREKEREEEREKDAEEEDYDVLPCRTRERVLEDEDDIYDIPVCSLRATEDTHTGCGETEENIYDVPSSLLRRLSEQSIGARAEGAWPSDGGAVPQGDDAGVRSGTVGWMTATAEG